MNRKKFTPQQKVESSLKVATALVNFFEELQRYNKEMGLPDKDNIYEVMTAMSDKHGRICREVKHIERQDPCVGGYNNIVIGIAGYLVYAQMVLKKYQDNIPQGEYLKTVMMHEFLKPVLERENQDA